jgi:hypothetical protein
MPCSDAGPSAADARREYENRQIMIRLACDRCREIEARGGHVPDWAKRWWMEHQLRDAERLMREEAARRSNAIREQAIAKLSAEERAELGV